MSTNEKDPSKTPTTIKIAAKDAAERATNGGADPGPGDMSAEPSEMPEPVNVPRPPTDSELVVKSMKTGGSRQIKTINDPVSLPKSRKSSASTKLSGTGGGGGGGSGGASASAGGSAGASQVQTVKMGSGGRVSAASGGSKSGGSKSGGGVGGGASGTSGGGGPGSKSGGRGSKSGGASGAGGVDADNSAGGNTTSGAAFEGSDKGVTESAGAATAGGASSMNAMQTQKTASGQQGVGLNSDTQSGASGGPGQEHDEEEEGEGEVETAGASPGPSPGPSGTSEAASPSETQPVSPDVGGPPSGGVDMAPASSGGGSSKMSPKTSAVSKKSAPVSASSASSASSHASSHHSHHGPGHGHGKKKKKKVTKFRYHKRITVRTHGKTSPSTIMHKVNKKDHKAGITPSTIEDMDTEELMKRAGIKGKKGTHWRVRLRQTKRISQGGKTVVQTKIAYRDSEGHKKVRTSDTPDCKTCGKKLEDCKCDEK